MNIYGCHFTYSGVDSNTYSLIIANVNTERDDRSAGDVTGEYIYRKSDKTFRLLGDDYSSSQMVFDVDIITENGSVLLNADRRAVEKWLFNKQTFRKLYIDKNDDPLGETYETINGSEKRLYMMCRFINPRKIETGCGVIGYSATLECDSGLLWQDEITYTYTAQASAESGTFNIVVDTNLNDYTYPDVVITTAAGCEEFSIYNQTDDSQRDTTFSGMSGDDVIRMNASRGYVDRQHYGYFSGLNFIRLLDGTNTFTYTGEIASITFTWNNRRFY